MTGTNTLPPDLQAAMRARDEAFYAVDSAQWGKYTASDFTTVQQNGQFMSRAERIGDLQTQKQRPYVPREREQHEQQGDLVTLWSPAFSAAGYGSWKSGSASTARILTV
jgi:hypothetical protein